MQLTAKQDIEAPIETVFAALTDFPSFERQALRRGAEVRRLDQPVRTGLGAAWHLAFVYRGRERTVRAEVTGFDVPNGLLLSATSGGLDGTTRFDLVALARNRTRLTVRVDLAPRTLAARLLVQSLKLGRSALERRLTKRLSALAEDISRQGDTTLAR